MRLKKLLRRGCAAMSRGSRRDEMRRLVGIEQHASFVVSDR